MSTPLVEPSSRLKNLPIYIFAWLDDLKEVARERGANLIDLGLGNPDRPTPEPVIEAIKNSYSTPSSHGYPPFKGTEDFRKAVCRSMKSHYGVDFDPFKEVLCLSGSKEGIAHLVMAYINQGDVALVPEIYYPVHSRAAWLVGGQVYHLPMKAEQGFLADFEHVPPDILKKAKLLILNYPNNPTGAVADLAYFEKAVNFCRTHGLVLVSDMAYAEIGFDGYKPPSVFEVPGAKDVAVEIYTCSKSFNMAGSRIGWAVGNADIIANLYAFRTNMGYGTPVAIQEGAIVALDRAPEFVKDVVSGYQARRELLVKGFQKLGWQITSPRAAMYVWLKVPKGFTSQEWARHLIDECDVVVTPGNAFGDGGEGWFRVSMVSPEPVLQTALDRLESKGIRYN